MAEVKPEFDSQNISFGGFISTPFFPMPYPDDLTFEQVINCKVSACSVHLIFVDFQIAEESIVEVPCKSQPIVLLAQNAVCSCGISINCI